MQAYERLLQYVTYETTSDDTKNQTPTTPGQTAFANTLAEEMKELGLSDVSVDEHSYVYGFIPASEGCENWDAIGFIAHLDTTPDVSCGKASPQVIRNYKGGEIPLGDSGYILKPGDFTSENELLGKTLITTDGTSLLGADDKAGVAEIMTMCERLLNNEHAHGRVCVCFAPDEEIGHGASLLDLEYFGADYAYTVDGSAPNEIEYETFHAAHASWKVQGISVHPGIAKDKMRNAMLVAMEINGLLPKEETPRETEGREGFFHLMKAKGDVSEAVLEYIIRDHDRQKFEDRKQKMLEIQDQICRKYGAKTAEVEIRDQYYNMAEIVLQYPQILQRAKAAISLVGLEPVSHPVRGGTDGAQLSFRGLPCPNLGTGGYGFHGRYEFAVAEEMEQVVEILLNIVKGTEA